MTHTTEILGTCAIDQYGNTYHPLGKHPRQALLERLGHSRAEKMYVDTVDGGSKHTGYVIGELWLTLYNVTQWCQPEVTT